MAKIKAVLLDIDGTLIDSNDNHAYAWVEAFAEHGRTVAFAEIRKRIGEGGDKLLPQTLGLSDKDPEGKVLNERRKAIFLTRYLPQTRVFPHCRDLLLRMREAGLTLTVATSASEEELNALLAHIGIADLLDQTANTDDAPQSKPDPGIIEAALKKSRVKPDESVMLGDTPYDVSAARKAGVATVAVRCGGWSDADLKGALAIYNDPADLLAHFDESPLARIP